MTCLAVGLASLGCGSKDQAPEAPTPEAPDPDLTGPDFFDDMTASAGIDFAYRNGEEAPHLAILESLGGGVVVIDFDRDGLPDLFLPGGGHYGGADNKQILGHPCRLYHNEGNWKFKDATAPAGLDKLAGGAPWFYTHAATVGDYDRDGWPDLLVTGWGRIALFHNESDGKGGRRFTDVSAAAGLDKDITWATSAAWADFDGDGWPDLFVCQYVDWSFANHPACNYDGKTSDVCPPKRFKGLGSKVYRNTGAGKFPDVSEEAGILKGGEHASKALGVVAVDVNLDGKPDVYVANDTVANFLYVNKSAPGKIRFEEKGLAAGVALDGGGNPNGSMGVDAGDPEGMGKPALWVTNYENEFHALYRNHSAGDRVAFVFATQSSGVGVIGQKFVGWGTGFGDFDLDGWEDIFIANGHAVRFPTGTTRSQKPVLFLNKGAGKFKDITTRGGTYFKQPHLSRGAVLADLDNDGRLDLAVSHTNAPATILRNVLPGRHWVGVELVGAGNRDVVGARITVEAGGRTQTRFAKGGGSYASAPDRRHVVGLGTETKIAKLAVNWPDGSRQEWADVPTDRYHVVTQGKKELGIWQCR
ncbi:CRTAC1 family protein [Gemmata sp. G18]|uniref:CRTAC1 family protein n=1 Tax=Gemmata palustris TaxID=2822762 RepID=A0ABS5BMC4_9BACT|nr:CRTAC1 family protein [Gemmata palustris]MBP3954825.1 CRTAC1 family protein [Gemmata palustris]